MWRILIRVAKCKETRDINKKWITGKDGKENGVGGLKRKEKEKKGN